MSDFHSSVSCSDVFCQGSHLECSDLDCSDLESLKTEFITTISHQVRTPLSVIFLSVELLKLHREDCTEAMRQAYLSQIYHAAKEINTLFNETLPMIDADLA